MEVKDKIYSRPIIILKLGIW